MPPPILFLRREEQKIFASLPDALREAWTVTQEEEKGDDQPEELAMRRRMTHFDAFPACQNILDQAARGEDVMDCLSSLAASQASEEILAELCFVLGTPVLSALLRSALSAAKKDTDLEGIASLSGIRHAMLALNLTAQQA